MQTLWQDIRCAIRDLSRARGFTLVALLTLALGIGANTALFSIVDSVLLRPLPYPHPERLVRITADMPGLNQKDIGLSYLEMVDYRDKAGVFDQIAGVWAIDSNITGGGEPERSEALLVSGTYFQILGTQAQLGRLFGPEDEIPGIAEATVISDGFWRRHFGADPNVIGRKLSFDNDEYTIVGVAPRGFHHPGWTVQTDPDTWNPTGFRASPFSAPTRNARFLVGGALARLKSGVTIEQARARINALAAELRREFPNDYPSSAGWAPRLEPLHDDLVGTVRPALLVLFAAVGFVLLIVCVNIANLLLARSSARHREFAIRAALGAGRGRLIAQLLTESLLLSLAGGALALVFLEALIQGLLRLAPANLPRLTEVGAHWQVLAFAAGISFATGILFGLIPAFQSSRLNLSEALKEGARGTQQGRRSSRLRGLLVVSEFALALVLMIGAGLLLRTFWNILRVDPGFETKDVQTARVWLPQPNNPQTGPYFTQEQRLVFIRALLRRLEALPGVEQSAVSVSFPLSGSRFSASFTAEGRSIEEAGLLTAQPFSVSPDYFRLLKIPVMRGREFTERDDLNSPGVAIVDEIAARLYWPNQDPIGKRIRFGGPASTQPWLAIVGIVRGVRAEGLDTHPRPHIYRSVFQASSLALAILLRGHLNPAALEATLRREVRAVDPALPVYAVRSMEDLLATTLAQRRFAMQLLGAFAAIALLLASIGIYGVMSTLVTQRTREMGIRMALGARRSDILRLVLNQGLSLALVGAAIGLAASFGLARLLSSLLFGTGAADPLTFLGATALLAGVALPACLLPARRATRVDPVVALRYE